MCNAKTGGGKYLSIIVTNESYSIVSVLIESSTCEIGIMVRLIIRKSWLLLGGPKREIIKTTTPMIKNRMMKKAPMALKKENILLNFNIILIGLDILTFPNMDYPNQYFHILEKC